jgi:predicted DNA-binding protein with PD1-like motif
MKVFAFRLKPGSDLKTSIEEVIAKQNIKAGFIISCVGGLQKAVVRMAGAKPAKQDIRTFEQDYEIVSLVGTVSVNGMHMHISFSDREGSVIGGHLKEGTIVHPTAEIVIGIDETREFGREIDNETGFKELIIN